MVTLFNLLTRNPETMNDLPLPDGIDPGILMDTIISQYGELDVVYQNPKVFHYYQGIWFRRKYNIFQKMVETTLYEYDPIENYNRMEDYWENNDDYNVNNANSHTTSDDGSLSEVSPYNAENFLNESKVTGNSESNRTDEITDTNERKKKGGIHAHGNIGVTTTQQMIEQERNVILYDVYDQISKMWAKEFVVQIW